MMFSLLVCSCAGGDGNGRDSNADFDAVGGG